MSQQFRSPSPNTGYPQWQQPSQPSHPVQPQQPQQTYPPSQQQQWSQPLPPYQPQTPQQRQSPIAHSPLRISPETPRPVPPERRAPGAARKGAIRLLLISMALCVIVALGSLYAFTRGNSSPRPASTPQAHTTQPAGQSTTSAAPTQGATLQPSQPTSKPTTQATTGINPGINSPILGGNLTAFTTKYGQPNSHSVPASGLYHYKQYPGSNLDFLIVNTDLTDGGVYVKHVESITVQAPDAGWSQQEATTTCAAFLPPDAVYKQQINLIYGYDNIYSSASLTQLFPASAFVDVNGKQVQAGLFDVEYLYQHGSKNIASCSFMVGTQQTQI